MLICVEKRLSNVYIIANVSKMSKCSQKIQHIFFFLWITLAYLLFYSGRDKMETIHFTPENLHQLYLGYIKPVNIGQRL